MKHIILYEPRFSQEVQHPVGFSWKYLFFGFLLSIFRKNYFEAISVSLLTFLTMGLYHIYFAGIYNRVDLQRKLNRGYKLAKKSQEYCLKIKMIDIDDIKLSRLGSIDGSATF